MIFIFSRTFLWIRLPAVRMTLSLVEKRHISSHHWNCRTWIQWQRKSRCSLHSDVPNLNIALVGLFPIWLPLVGRKPYCEILSCIQAKYMQFWMLFSTIVMVNSYSCSHEDQKLPQFMQGSDSHKSCCECSDTVSALRASCSQSCILVCASSSKYKLKLLASNV